jgi:hypothetical protein
MGEACASGVMTLNMKDIGRITMQMVREDSVLGVTYEGDWHEDKRNDVGVETWPDALAMKDNTRWVRSTASASSTGLMNLSRGDGKKYEGEHMDDKKHDYGVFEWPDGRKYKGNWENGKQHGRGVYFGSSSSEKEGE